MMNKADTLKALQSKLSTDVRWAQRGLLAIFRNQTADEQIQANLTPSQREFIKTGITDEEWDSLFSC